MESPSKWQGDDGNGNSSSLALEHLREENRELKERWVAVPDETYIVLCFMLVLVNHYR